MNRAIIRTGGQQYRVSEGDTLCIANLPGDVGQAVVFDEVLALTSGGAGQGEAGTVSIGQPFVSGAKVTAEIVQHGRGEKLIVFKFRRRKRYKRKMGHRQGFTQVKITGISG